MAQIHAPYNFVPLNKEVYIPEWHDQISLDIPFSDGEDGIIRVEFRNRTPLFTKNDVLDSKDNQLSAYVTDTNGRRHFYLPATGVKGMVRSTMEVLSFARMKQYDDDFFGFRVFGRAYNSNKEYQSMMQGVCCGWLRMVLGENGDETYELRDCGEIDCISMEQLPAYYKEVKGENAVEKMAYFVKKGVGRYPLINDKHLVCTGAMQGKRHEYLFPRPEEGTPLSVDSKVVDAFEAVYKPSPYFDFIKERMLSGEYIAVFFNKVGGKVKSLGVTKMYRLPRKHRVSEGVSQCASQGHDLPECIFGYAEKGMSLKGRVQFGNAFCPGEISDFVEITGVLGRPNASYFPLYVRQDGNAYRGYDDDGFEIAGRKKYRVHADRYITPLPQGNDNENVKSKLKLIPRGHVFVLEIKLHNLRPVEIGALLSSLTFHGTKSAFHNFGMAKSFGYGKLEIKNLELQYLSLEVDDYLKAFEREMSAFLMKASGKNWIKSEQVRQLIAIACEHDKNLEMMTLEEYGEAKKNNNFFQLSEVHPAIAPLLDELDIKRTLYKPDYELLKVALVEENCVQIETYCQKIEQALRPLNDPFIEECRERVKQIKYLHEQQRLTEKEKEEREVLSKRLEAGLAATLDETYPGDPTRYKVKDFKVLLSKIKKWLKDAGREQLDNDEAESVAIAVERIYGMLKEKERKTLEAKDKGLWKNLLDFLTAEKVDAMYKKLYN